MKYAVIKSGGKQYKVEEGQTLEVELLKTDGKTMIFDEVLLFVDGDQVELGAPTISGFKVYADVISDVKGEKIEVFKYKSKSRYRKHTGHRQKYTQVKITGLGAIAEKKTAKPVEKKEPAKKTAVKKAVVKKAPAKKIVK